MIFKGEVPSTDKVYAVGVKFLEYNEWSKTYVYKSTKPYRVGDRVLVPTNRFYNIGQVIGCKDDYTFKLNIKYKYIIHSLREINDA